MTASDAQPSLFAQTGAVPAGPVFFALMPDAAAVARIVATSAGLRDRFGWRARSIDPARFHVTLADLGEFADLPPDLLRGARAAAETIQTPAFDAGFDAVASFGGGRAARPVVLVHAGNDSAIVALHDRLHARLRANGVRVQASRSFAPHLTLLYDPIMVAPSAIEPVGWRVRDFALLHGRKGARAYEVLGRWRLGEPEH